MPHLLFYFSLVNCVGQKLYFAGISGPGHASLLMMMMTMVVVIMLTTMMMIRTMMMTRVERCC